MSDVRKFWLSFVMICAASFMMHVLVFSKRQSRDQHHPPQYPTAANQSTDAFLPQGPPLVGKVSVLGTDRFYLESEGHRYMFMLGTVPAPRVGAQVRVHYYQGSPPQLIKVELAP